MPIIRGNIARSVASVGLLARRTMFVQGDKREWIEYVPSTRNHAVAGPLVMVLHPLSKDMDWMMDITGYNAYAEQDGWLVVYPNSKRVGLQKQWDTEQGQQDSIFLNQLVAELRKQYLIDASRVYWSAMSNGGAMAYRMAADYSLLVAAMGNASDGMTHDAHAPTRPIHLLKWHGANDFVIDTEGNSFYRSVTDLINFWTGNAAGQADVQLRMIQGEGHWWFSNAQAPPGASAAMWQFFRDHVAV